jgi:hypothetical protein
MRSLLSVFDEHSSPAPVPRKRAPSAVRPVAQAQGWNAPCYFVSAPFVTAQWATVPGAGRIPEQEPECREGAVEARWIGRPWTRERAPHERGSRTFT